MSTYQPDISAEETARRGDEIYERIVRPEVEASCYGKVVAIDVWSSAYAVDDNARMAARRLREQHPDAEVWFVRVGQPALHRVGARPALTRA